MSLFKSVAAASQPAATPASSSQPAAGGAARDAKPLLWPYVMSTNSYNKTIVPGDSYTFAPQVDTNIQMSA